MRFDRRSIASADHYDAVQHDTASSSELHTRATRRVATAGCLYHSLPSAGRWTAAAHTFHGTRCDASEKGASDLECAKIRAPSVTAECTEAWRKHAKIGPRPRPSTFNSRHGPTEKRITARSKPSILNAQRGAHHSVTQRSRREGRTLTCISWRRRCEEEAGEARGSRQAGTSNPRNLAATTTDRVCRPAWHLMTRSVCD